jgi:hypothetical protein
MHDHATLIGHVFLFLTTVAGFVFAWLREGRQHRWQVEEFRKLNAEVKNGHAK